TSIYDAMVRMSQDWKNNITLLDMHGNKGSIDGDDAAAMRYTECRLSQFGECLVENLDKNTVQFVNNFDDSEQEPVVLPTILPNLLINGASGIAAGYATNIPPFNPNEVIDAIITRIDSPNCHLKSILNVMPGPDFPTGGLILNPEEIRIAYETGKGKITLRGKMEVLNARQIKISSIPYETNKSAIIRQIDELKEKYDSMGIKEVRDESDKNGVSIILECQHTKNFELIKNIIYKESQLQVSYGMNFVAILKHKPVQFPILLALDTFIEHINEVVVAASKYDLDKAVARKEIVEGLIKAIGIIDDVVELIRRAQNKDEAKKSIMSRFMFTANQAEAIVNLRLYRLSNTDVSALKTELDELVETISKLKLLISNSTVRNNHIKEKLRKYKKIFARPRLSEISSEDAQIKLNESDKIEDKEIAVSVTYDGYLKAFSRQTLSSVEYETIQVKAGDLPIIMFNSNLKHKVILITSKGNYISIPTFKIEQAKWKDIGEHINNIINIAPDEKIIFGFNYANLLNDPRGLVLLTKNGYIKKTDIPSLNISRIIKSSTVMNLDEGDELAYCILLPNVNMDAQLALVSNGGNAYKCNLNEISCLGKNASGVKAMKLDADQKMGGMFVAEDPNGSALLCAYNGMKRIRYDEIPSSKRPSKGVSILGNTKTNPTTLFNAYDSRAGSLIQVVNDQNELKFYKATDIPLGDRTARITRIGNSGVKNANIYYYIKDTSGAIELPTETVNEEVVETTTDQPTLFDDEKE
ncbi:MAG: hypothetical protein HUJ52_01870, partial [Malacoplasma sp.]|nr:hypothetical protein [Malacoplasma sp.]